MYVFFRLLRRLLKYVVVFVHDRYPDQKEGQKNRQPTSPDDIKYASLIFVPPSLLPPPPSKLYLSPRCAAASTPSTSTSSPRDPREKGDARLRSSPTIRCASSRINVGKESISATWPQDLDSRKQKSPAPLMCSLVNRGRIWHPTAAFDFRVALLCIHVTFDIVALHSN